MQHIEDKNHVTCTSVSDPEATSRISASDAAPDSDVINLLDYLEVIARGWRMIAKVMAITFVISIGIALQLPKIYSSTALILPPQQDNSMMGMMSAMTGGMASLATDLLGKGTTADLYVGMLKSNAVKDALINRFKLMEVYEQKFRLDTYNKLDDMATIESDKKSGIISITVEDEDPKLATDLANAFVDELGKLRVRLNIDGANDSRKFFEERLVKSKIDLTRAEEALKSFQSSNKALDVPEQAKASITGIAELKAQLASQEVQLSALRSRFTDSAQEVKDLKVTIGNLRGQIAQFEGKGGSSSIPSVGNVPRLGQEYVRLMREFKIQEAIFELLTKQFEMAKMGEAKNIDGMQVIQRATVPDKKSKPKRAKIVLAMTFSAGLCALLYVFLREGYERSPREDREQWDRIRGMLPNPFGFVATLFRRIRNRSN